MCWEGPFFPTHKGVGGGRQGASPKATTMGVRAVGAEFSFSSTSFPNRAEEWGGTHTQGEEPSFPRIRRGQERGCYPTPISQTIAKVKDLVSESMRWVMGMWWGKQRMLETGLPSHTVSPALEENRDGGQGQWAAGARGGGSAITGQLLQRRHSVCASCSQSQRQSQPCVCRCL